MANHEKEGQVAPAHHEHWKSLNVKINLCDCVNLYQLKTWLPDGYSKILRSYMFGPSGFWTMAPLRYAAKFDPLPFLGVRPHALHPGAIQGKEGIKFCHLATLVEGNLQNIGEQIGFRYYKGESPPSGRRRGLPCRGQTSSPSSRGETWGCGGHP